MGLRSTPPKSEHYYHGWVFSIISGFFGLVWVSGFSPRNLGLFFKITVATLYVRRVAGIGITYEGYQYPHFLDWGVHR